MRRLLRIGTSGRVIDRVTRTIGKLDGNLEAFSDEKMLGKTLDSNGK